MRIAFLSPILSGRGGMESAIRGLALGFAALGHEPRVYLLGGPPPETAWLEQVPYAVFGNAQQSRLRRFHEYSFGLAKEFRSFRPDVVVSLDGPRLLKGKIALALARRRAATWSWIHFPMKFADMRALLRLADGHLAISEGVANELRDFLGERRKGRVKTIYNPIQVDVPGVSRPVRGEPAVFLHVGRLEWDRQKRVNDLLAAASRLTGDFRVVIVGDGIGLAQLQQYGRELGLESRIEWLGWKSNPWASVQQASVLLLTSSYEGFPMILIEALAHGVPCITSDCKFGPDEIVEEGTSGWFYPVGDVEALARRMQQIIDHPEILPSAETLRQSAARFSSTAVAERACQAFASNRSRG
jgi:UDP-D-galactose:(glucosyl)LPS alpha-1,6-D-galactosyltransferase